MAQGTQGFPCPECDAEFHEREDLETHLEQVHHRALPESFRCPVCGELFESLEDLNAHGRLEHYEGR